ncbi:response regulator [Desulfotalea psychrophila]|uniref:Related to two-component system response regulator (Ntr family) n=1 Tax=Desulfotalea psychrophila (strain LSv54 / DSM 12343) TaxID=177439 RepID=Q6ALG8_DESPS|nr:response regulator [Desulfotalea psychrophila]CAG36807.1 related to two-component system response regulator (Ntr family) [Desulfotalea psychrophila LSv54]
MLAILQRARGGSLPITQDCASGLYNSLVDDETILCELFKRSLEAFGYEVTSFSDSLNAFKHFQQNYESYDIVVVDMTMPNLTGLDLIKEILRICPDSKSILCTGYNSTVTETKALSSA